MSSSESGSRASRSQGEQESTAAPVGTQREQYLIAQKAADTLPQGVEPLDLSVLEERLKEDEEIDFKRTVTPRGLVSAMGTSAPGAQSVMVAAMAPERAETLRQMPQLIVERDEPLDYSEPQPVDLSVRDPGTLVPQASEFAPTIVVRGEDDQPLSGATVFVFGRLWPYQGVTGDNGKVTLTIFGEQGDALKGLYVKPKADHWNVYVERPMLRADEDNVVSLPPLSRTLEGFPDQEVLGWGQQAMRVHEVSPDQRGKGVRVAVIDSGASANHRDLEVTSGFDITTSDADSWKEDTIGHGSHCAGIITGADNGRGVVGMAPDAELHVYKIFPGGRFSDLLDALDHCITQQVDVANLSLGGGSPSQLVEDKLELAKKMGIACIVAVGNSAGPVQFPASSSQVLGVSAIGKQGAFPAESYHATQIAPQTRTDPEGYFSAKFTCFGPEVDVCGPGVGIVSSIPPDNYAAWDGTSMAAPHVTGLAALVLAHHPDFEGRFRLRSAERVDRLFEIIKESTRPLDLGDSNRTGAGLPDCVRALGSPEASGRGGQPTQGEPRASAGDGGGSTAVDQLQTQMREAGLLPGGRTKAKAADQPAVPAGAVNNLSRLASLMETAGLRQGAGGGKTSPLAAADAPADDPMRGLREAMEEAGLARQG